MAALYVKKGFGQVEANRLTGIVSGAIEAQSPAYQEAAATNPIKTLENGMFLCLVHDPGNTSPTGKIAVLPAQANADAVPMLVFSEHKTPTGKGYSDFVMNADDTVDGRIIPRLVGLTPDACVFTTNTVAESSLAKGDKLYVADDGYLKKAAGRNKTYQFTVLKVYTMPDGQPGVKLLCQKKQA